MSLMRWLPWQFIIRRAARSQGFLDPIELMARMRQLAQPSEVGEPIELLRAGLVFHARGLINTKVIQHNLDWVWPYWIERQFDPKDESFIPRSFSISHINLTHRNWTAIGQPDWEELPIVDPRGLLTPLLDGWSLDSWIITEDGRTLLPSRARSVEQYQELDPGVAVITRGNQGGLSLQNRAEVRVEDGRAICTMTATADSDSAGWLVLALRPCNPEGVSFVHKVNLAQDRKSWLVDDVQRVEFSEPAQRHHVSDYHHGDVFIHLNDQQENSEGRCKVGMVTAAAMFPIGAGGQRRVTVSVPLPGNRSDTLSNETWRNERAQTCRLECPEPRYQFLYDAAVTSLVLHSPGDVYPGPYTYKRFWFRDAAFLIHAMLCVGLEQRAARALERFPDRQTPLGYFRSQEGEWDANGEVLWILLRYEQLTGKRLGAKWEGPIKRAARWITRKRVSADIDAPHAGLLPAGFSAEHLGPNDYYFWDDFWGVAGLKAAHQLLRDSAGGKGDDFDAQADDFASAIDRSLESCARRLRRPGMPASPYRRLDAGAIGSLAVGYPLQDCRPDDPRLLDTVNFLLSSCFIDGAFFQDMIHSGLNAYLTLHVAQILLRADDPRYLDLMDAVAAMATTTGQWPEAVHPRTMGGCMGDGHHVWASAEWVLMVRHLFLREEGERLVLCAGIPSRWLRHERPIAFGPSPTAFGPVSVVVTPCAAGQVKVEWDGNWRSGEPTIELRLPGHPPRTIDPGTTSLTLSSEVTDT